MWKYVYTNIQFHCDIVSQVIKNTMRTKDHTDVELPFCSICTCKFLALGISIHVCTEKKLVMYNISQFFLSFIIESIRYFNSITNLHDHIQKGIVHFCKHFISITCCHIITF